MYFVLGVGVGKAAIERLIPKNLEIEKF